MKWRYCRPPRHEQKPKKLRRILINTEKEQQDLLRQQSLCFARRNDMLIPIKMIDADLGIFAPEFIEAVLHYKYIPKYEGFSSQR